MIRSLLVAVLLLTTMAFAGPVPRPAPTFVIHLTPSGQITPEQYRGKVLILNFIFTTCPHCQLLTKYLNGLQKEYGPRGLQVISAAFNDLPNVPNFINEYKPLYPVGSTSRADVLKFVGRPSDAEMYVPITVFIDRKGVIRGEFMGDDAFFANYEKNIRARVEELLKPAAPITKSKANPKKKVS